MKKLNRIVLVNWYLLGAEEINIRGNTAIIGPTGSGKSSLLDAIQTVLTGASKRHLNYNASANDGKASGRSIRSYILGMIDSGQANSKAFGTQPRQDATSYLALVFEDSITGKESTVGLALSASLASPEEDVLGRFVLSNFGARKSDFIDAMEGKSYKAKPWIEVRETMKKVCLDPYIKSGSASATQYINRYLEELSPSPDHLITLDSFLKNFKNALKFVPIASPTRFVQDFVLAEAPLQVGAYQKSLHEYRHLEAKTLEVSKRIDDLKLIQQDCEKKHQQEQSAINYQWIATEARFDELGSKQDDIQDQYELQKEREEEIEEELATQGSLLKQLQGQLLRFEQQYEHSDVGLKLQQLEQNKKLLTLQGQQDQKAILQVRQLTLLLSALNSFEDLLSKETNALVKEFAAFNGLITEEGRVEGNLKPLTQKLIALNEILDREKSQVFGQRSELNRTILNLKDECKQLESDVSSLKGGVSPLSQNTKRLIALLKDANITATPLSHLSEVTDRKWQDAIEGYLGAQREALIVEPEDAEESIRIFRAHRRQLMGCRVIDTTQTRLWLNRGDNNSALRFIRCNNDHAQAYLNRRLGGIKPVDTERELLREDSAMTADGMLKLAGTISTIRFVPHMMVGINTEGMRESREKQLASLSGELMNFLKVDQRLEQADSLLGRVMANNQFDAESIGNASHTVTRLTQELESVDAEISQLQKHDDTELQERIEELKLRIANVELDQKKLDRERQQIAEQFGALNTQKSQLSSALSALDEERNRLTSNPKYDAEFASERYALLEGSMVNGAAIYKEAISRADKASEKARSFDQKVRKEVADHYGKYHHANLDNDVQLDYLESKFEEFEHYVSYQIDILSETELAKYAKRAELARKEAEETFRSDYVSKLKDSLDQVAHIIRELNHSLKRRPFNQEIYQFRYYPNGDMKDILDLVERFSAQDQANVGGLFDPHLSNDPDHIRAIASIQELISDDEKQQDLADYRKFYNFEVDILDAEGNKKTTLSQRIQTGSGGEHQIPFYLAIAAALSTTYRLHETMEGEIVGGFSLAMFDEAFNKIDMVKTSTCMGFMKDIGLQVIAAAPDDKRAVMAANMDTIISVWREGGAVSIDVAYPKEKGQVLLNGQSDNLATPA
ncbi:MAG: AAA family ATPase [Gammaproteobacteria bacterium]|uniref:SbcC/MukB-like Walker B domain-containing protein n=1 Tax=Marinomonas polaris TaxID=293552 RepID=UPI001DCF3FDA|nr:AAA family ATPase [Gammaproteobacteria bacterium]MBU1465624.1 AAA family ATPase [Gammaproteobacteria bacterium]MBU2021713.1 AAA family ATPase [Gammaproteobacteria bacterium]MBU2237331.1 AAA family ATPase [Gammaproteobacteria bacterium]MBU2414876.1 AAA family ATPase [Gammaproteobacteria bacterium]